MTGDQDAFPARYELRVRGRLPPRSASWFEEMTVAVEDGAPVQTVLRGTVRDQAALYGLVTRLRDLGLTLESIRHVEWDREAADET